MSESHSHGDAPAADRPAANALFDTLYGELHRLAERELARRGRGTLGVTTLLHEAYLDIAGRARASFPDEARFLRYASRVMRGLIIDHARRRAAQKRGVALQITGAAIEELGAPAGADLSAVGDALEELAAVDAGLVEVVDLKFFCGFSFAEIAAMRGVSERTIQRDWEKARIYLHRRIGAPARR